MLMNGLKAKYTGNSVIVHIAVWREKGEFDEHDVEMNRDDLPPDCLQPHENPESTPHILGRRFDLLACRLPAMEGPDCFIQPEEIVRDAWDMRAQFFALKDDLNATSQFLNRWGLWSFQLVREPSPSHELFPCALISPHRLWSLRDAYIKAAASSPRSWLTTATPLRLKETDKIPYFIVERSYCEDTIKATLTIDHLGNVKFGICKRHDCRKLFKRKTAQRRLYCTPYCAHIENVRKIRKAKAKLTGKGTKKNAQG